MPTLMSMEDYQALKKKYQAEAEAQNNPQVGEFLSGQAQHLKAAPNAVDYKNFNGQNIEETTLVKNAFNQNLQTNITESYARGVTSTITEVAPSIHHEANLTDSYSATYQSATENINVQKEVQNINVTNWQATHQNLNLTVPGTLKQQIMQSGNITVDQYQAQIQHQTIKSGTYTHNFDTATFDGPVNIQSSGQIHFAGDIHIGPDTTALTPASIRKARQDNMLVPKVSAEFELSKIKLMPYVTSEYTMDGDLSIVGRYEAVAINSVSPFAITPSTVEIEAEVSKVIQDYFVNLQVTSTTESGNLNTAPSLTVSNQQGDYTFSNGAVAYTTPLVLRVGYSTAASVEKKPFEGWRVTLTCTLNLALNITRKDKMTIDNKALVNAFRYFTDAVTPESALEEPAIASGLMTRLQIFEYALLPVEE